MQRIDASAHVRGAAQFVDDIPPPLEMLHAAVLPSPVARGRIRALNLQPALARDGVVTVLTASNIPGNNLWGSIIPDWPLLATDEVQYAGQPIAVVVGTTRAIAQAGVRAIVLDVVELPAIVDPREAYARQQTFGPPRTFTLGDVDRAWEHCDCVVEGTCEIGGQEHLYLETQRARAIPLEGRTMRVYAATQNPYGAQRTIADMLGWPYHAIEVDVTRLGGGFGGKEEQATPWACYAALAAWHTQTPVQIVLSRRDDLLMTGHRHPYSSDFKIGMTAKGEILAFEARHYQNAGAYADLSTAVLERSLFHSTNAYFIPNVRVFGVSCRTNLPPNTALRGFGGPQAMVVIESAIAKAAEALNVPREEIQSKNLLQPGDTFPYGQILEEASPRLMWDRADSQFHLADIRDRIDRYNASHFETKRGFAVMPICFGISFTAKFLNQASALVHVYTDGSVSVTTGGVEMGQGLNSKIAAIAARAFGIGLNRIKVESTNTTRIANMSASAASVTTDLNGQATVLAIEQIMGRLRHVAATELGVANPRAIAIADETISIDGRASELTWPDLVAAAHFSRTDLSAHAFYATPNIDFDRDHEQGHPFAYHVCGTAIVEVTLDCLRGTYTIDAAKIVHDLGRSVNELVDRGQVEGGLGPRVGLVDDRRLAI